MIGANERLRVFMVEDEALIAMELEAMLEDLDCEVIGPAASVPTALDLLASCSPAPHVAVVDANLGGKSALPVVQALRERDIPVALASGYEPHELEQLGFEKGPLIRQPYSLPHLEKTLRALRHP